MCFSVGNNQEPLDYGKDLVTVNLARSFLSGAVKLRKGTRIETGNGKKLVTNVYFVSVLKEAVVYLSRSYTRRSNYD